MPKKRDYEMWQISSRKAALAGLVLWFLCVPLLVFSEHFLVKTAFGFPLLVVLPGFLFLLTIRIKNNYDIFSICFSVTSSLVILMMFGLSVNFLLPVFGLIPLKPVPLLISLSLLISLLAVKPILHNRNLNIYKISTDRLNGIFIGISFVLLIALVIGALRLNNGYSGDFVMYTLYVMAIYIVAMTVSIHRITDFAMSIILYVISLGLLLMTSLRGWGIVGHDIVREYSVFMLTKDAGFWSYESLRDAYDACISISILPTMFSEILSIPDPYVYKILFQLIFAVIPVLCFILFSKYFTRFIAFLAVLILISFPTFFSDMPMLNRQEIAFLLFSTMIYILFETNISNKAKNLLTLFFGSGIVLSHYSTTYIVIIFLFTSWFGFWFFKFVLGLRFFNNHSKKRGIFRVNYIITNKPTVSIIALIFLILLSFLWSNVFTGTSDSSIKRVLIRTFQTFASDSENPRSSDTLYSLFSTNKMTESEILQSYKTDEVSRLRNQAFEGTYYTESVFDTFTPILSPAKNLPPTLLGITMQSWGVNVTELNQTLKFGTAKILQLLLLIGIITSLFATSSKFFKYRPRIEYLLLATAGVILLVAMVLIPVLSVEYGVLRAFQQALLIVAPFIIIGSLTLFSIFGDRLAKIISVVFVILFFLTSTGAITQALGGYKPLLHLNNSGPYYDFFYVKESETSALTWITNEAKESIVQSEIQLERYVSSSVNEKSKLDTDNEIYPGLLRKDAYVLLGTSNVHNGNMMVTYEGVQVNIELPLDLLNTYKNKVYDTNDAIIYR